MCSLKDIIWFGLGCPKSLSPLIKSPFLNCSDSQENSCIINVGVQKNLVMLKALVAFMDPIFAKHLGKF